MSELISLCCRAVLLFGVILAAFPAFANGAVSSANWHKFMRIQSQYYYLDTQNSNKISCDIRVPKLNKDVSVIKKILGKKIEVHAGMDKYHLVFSRTSPLQIKSPNLRFTTEADVSKAKDDSAYKEQQYFHKGFDAQVAKINSALRALFENLVSPRRADTIVNKIIESDRGYTINLQYKGEYFHELVLPGKTIVTEGKQKSGNKEIDLFEKTETGKWLLRTFYFHGVSHGRGFYVKVDANYQKLNEILFPKEISLIAAGNYRHKPWALEYEISLRSCHTEM